MILGARLALIFVPATVSYGLAALGCSRPDPQRTTLLGNPLRAPGHFAAGLRGVPGACGRRALLHIGEMFAWAAVSISRRSQHRVSSPAFSPLNATDLILTVGGT